MIIVFITIASIVLLSIDFYAYQAIKTALPNHDGLLFKAVSILFWIISFLIIASMIYMAVRGDGNVSRFIRIASGLLFFLSFVSKIFLLVWLFGEDIYRLVSFGKQYVSSGDGSPQLPSRRKLISRLAIISAFVPLGTLAYGILRNAYRYQFREVSVALKTLPKSFEGFKIVQLSDIHSGSFNQTKPIIEVIKQINALEADVILFTGDLVNDLAHEMDDYKAIFSQLKAKHGVMSVTGNHDYGLYTYAEDDPVRHKNFEDFKQVHADMGWDLLMDENRILERNGEEIAILGVQNWGKAHYFPKYGDMKKAVRGLERVDTKILLSHDPSHWSGEVLPNFKDIALTLSGHTHGFQFGVETEHFKWSPSQYAYPQWAGLYNDGEQQLYVNRGFGFLGYPGRIGILPEVTVMTLTQG